MPPQHRGGFDPFNAAKNVLPAINNPFNQPKPSFIAATFGPYATMIGIGIFFVAAFVGIYFYFKTYGYTIQMGWDKLKQVFNNKDQIDINTTEDGDTTSSVSLIPPPPPIITPSASASASENTGLAPSQLPFSPDERPSGMPGAIEGPGFLGRTLDSMEKAFGPGKQIFNINRNIYTYDDAAPVCKAMGAELATFEQVKQAQKHGADWCNYGWVKGQMAVYPTSEATWNKLQTGPQEYRNSCGKPGVNGGRFDNPDIRFGVNCFGTRPQKKDTDELVFNTETGLPPTAEQIEFDKKVQKFRDEMENITVLPWSRGSWSA
jgi:hypothetical protein